MFEDPITIKQKILHWIELPFEPEIDLSFLGVNGKIKCTMKNKENNNDK